MPGSYLLPLDQGNLFSYFCMLLDSCNHPGRIGPAARALQVPGNGAVSVLSNLRCGYDVAVIGALIHHILVIIKPIKISRDRWTARGSVLGLDANRNAIQPHCIQVHYNLHLYAIIHKFTRIG